MNRPGMTGERCVALFLLGVVVFNPPLLSAVSKEYFVAGVPVLYVFIFIAWAALLALVARTARLDDRASEGPHSGPFPPSGGEDA